MVNFCTNCGCEIRKDANFCTNCGAKIRNENNFCFNCGAKIRNDYNFCINCGTKIDKTNTKHNSTSKKSLLENVEKILMDQKIEEKKKKLKTIDEIFETEEIKTEIIKNNADKKDVIFIKELLKNELFNKKKNMSNNQIKNFIKSELKDIGTPIEKEIPHKKTERKVVTNGGYCGFGCRHCYEEFFDGGGAIDGDFDSEGYVEYYCQLGHNISFGRFCKYYE